MSATRTHALKPDLSSASAAIDKFNPEPLYSQIEKLIMKDILSGTLVEGDSFRSEKDLAKFYKVSRMTARQALQNLKMKGYAVSIRRKGTFVSKPKIEKTLMRLQGFSQEMLSRGLTPSSRVLQQEVISAPSYVAGKLQLELRDKVFHLKRLRLASNVPIAIEDSFTPVKYFPGLERTEFSKNSLYSTLSTTFGVALGWSDDVIEASKSTAEEARLLTIPRGFSILSISRLVMTAQGQPIETVLSRYRGDRYRAMIRIPR